MSLKSIGYDDVPLLKEALVGRRITAMEIVTGAGEDDGSFRREGFDTDIHFYLDDGSILTAQASDGGCGCTNGCFSVEPGSELTFPSGVITNVSTQEEVEDWSGELTTIIDGGGEVPEEGNSTISLFIYTEMGQQALVVSGGGDNGYYGWGYGILLHNPAITEGDKND